MGSNPTTYKDMQNPPFTNVMFYSQQGTLHEVYWQDSYSYVLKEIEVSL